MTKMKYSLSALLPHIVRYGRTYVRDQSLYFDWTNAGFAFRFCGTQATVHIAVTAPRSPLLWLEITVDQQTYPMSFFAGRYDVPLTGNDSGEHTVTVRKRSEIGIGTVAITGITLNGSFLSMQCPERHIEFIGDSLVCGHGNLSSESNAPFDTCYEGGTQSFGVLAARSLGYECTVVGRSGLGLVANYDARRKYTMSNTYLQTAFWDGINEPWNFDSVRYDACVVSLGTNDWVAKVSKDEFISSAISFIRLLRQTHPTAHIVWCYGFIEESMEPFIRQAIKQSREDNIGYLAFMPTKDPNLLGCGHPNLLVHQQAAAVLADYLKTKL